MKMKKMLFIMSCIIITGMGMQSCKPNEAKVQSEVEKVLRTDYSSVSTSYKDGVATLSGTVKTQQEKTAAENAARSVKNVKSVVNNIIVQQTAQSSQSVTVNSDDDIRTSINNRLKNEGFESVTAVVSNGEVTLSGNLKRDNLSKVMQIANEAKPKRVINNLNLQ